MSLLQRIVPVGLAVGLGVLNGVFVFKPALDDRQHQKDFGDQHDAALAPDQASSAAAKSEAEIRTPEPSSEQKDGAKGN